MWLVGSSKIKSPGSKSTNLANATSPFCPSESNPIFVLIISPCIKNPAAIERISSSLFFPETAIKQSKTL